MQISETKTEGLEREFKIVVPAGEIDAKITARLKQLSQSVNVPGFRPGKAPVSLLKKKYGPAVMGEVLEQTLNDTTMQVMTERKLRPLSQPAIQISKFDQGQDLEFTMSLELTPDFEPADLKSIKLERLVAEPAESDLEASLTRIAEANRSVEKVEESRPANKGDMVLIDFTGSIAGEEFAGGKAEDYLLELGSGSFIPGFEDKLEGAKAGDVLKIEIKFPDDYGASNLAGKEAVFDVTVKELREPKAAIVDDELAKKLGLENLGALKKAVRESYENDFKQLSRTRLKRSLLDALNDAHKFEIPKKIVEQEAATIWEQYEKHRAAGQPDAELKDKSEDELKEEFRGIAERRVRLGLVLSEVGRRNNIEVTQDDINKAISTQARQFPGNEQAVIDYYRKSPEQRDALRAPLFEDKIVDFMLEMVTITDRQVTPDELRKEPEEAAGAAEDEAKNPAKKKSAKTKAEPKS